MDWGGAKAIETRYHGHRFRSRLEARHAVFMDAVGVEWLYEPEGFDLDGLWYLPDFWLPRIGCWLEVKPRVPREFSAAGRDAQSKALRLANRTGHPVGFATGGFDPLGFGVQFYLPEHETEGEGPTSFDWAACLRCGRIGLADDDGIHWPSDGEDDGGWWRGYPPDLRLMPCGHGAVGSTQALEAAYVAARSARFERGR